MLLFQAEQITALQQWLRSGSWWIRRSLPPFLTTSCPQCLPGGGAEPGVTASPAPIFLPTPQLHLLPVPSQESSELSRMVAEDSGRPGPSSQLCPNWLRDRYLVPQCEMLYFFCASESPLVNNSPQAPHSFGLLGGCDTFSPALQHSGRLINGRDRDHGRCHC